MAELIVREVPEFRLNLPLEIQAQHSMWDMCYDLAIEEFTPEKKDLLWRRFYEATSRMGNADV